MNLSRQKRINREGIEALKVLRAAIRRIEACAKEMSHTVNRRLKEPLKQNVDAWMLLANNYKTSPQ